MLILMKFTVGILFSLISISAFPHTWTHSPVAVESAVSVLGHKVKQKNDDTLLKLGEYGNAHIQLYRRNDACFIYIPGRNAQGKVVSGAIWSPRNGGNALYVIPNASNVLETLNNMIGELSNEDDMLKRVETTGSFIYFQNQKYDLYTLRKNKKEATMLLSLFDDSLSPELTNNSNFLVSFDGPYTQGNEQARIFELDGMHDAMMNYTNHHCK